MTLIKKQEKLLQNILSINGYRVFELRLIKYMNFVIAVLEKCGYQKIAPIKDLKQIRKYRNAKIFTKTKKSGLLQNIKTTPLPLMLWEMEASQ